VRLTTDSWSLWYKARAPSYSRQIDSTQFILAVERIPHIFWVLTLCLEHAVMSTRSGLPTAINLSLHQDDKGLARRLPVKRTATCGSSQACESTLATPLCLLRALRAAYRWPSASSRRRVAWRRQAEQRAEVAPVGTCIAVEPPAACVKLKDSGSWDAKLCFAL
jgi:hypothetical protein